MLCYSDLTSNLRVLLLCFQIAVVRNFFWMWELRIHIVKVYLGASHLGFSLVISEVLFSPFVGHLFVKSELLCVPWRTFWSQSVQCWALAVPFLFCHCLFLSSAFHGASVLWSSWWIPIYKAAQWFEFLPHGYSQVLTLCLNKANWILQISWNTEQQRWPFQWSGWWAPLHFPVYRWDIVLTQDGNKLVHL